MDVKLLIPDTAPDPPTDSGLRVEQRTVATYSPAGDLVSVVVYDERGRVLDRLRLARRGASPRFEADCL
jgi:hypothetical protein